MSWFKVAFGLISTVAGTKEARQAIENLRSAIRKDPPDSEPRTASPVQADYQAIEALIAQQRSEIDRNLEAVVHMLNRQNEALAEANRRQRIWNIALATAFVIAIIVSILT